MPEVTTTADATNTEAVEKLISEGNEKILKDREILAEELNDARRDMGVREDSDLPLPLDQDLKKYFNTYKGHPTTQSLVMQVQIIRLLRIQIETFNSEAEEDSEVKIE